MHIETEEIPARDLRPGDLFSIYGDEYWSHIDDNLSIGEKVWLRTNAPASYAPDADEPIFRLTIVLTEEEAMDKCKAYG